MVRKFQDSLPEEQQRRCIAVGIMTDEDGQNPERVWAISGMRSIIDESVMELKPGMEPVSDPTEQFEFVHAEIRLLQEAERQKKRLRVVAAGRLICDECVDQLDKLEVRIVTQPLHPYRPRPHKKVPSLPPITHPTQQKPGTSNVEFPPSDTPKIINPETTRKKKNDPSQ